MDHLRIQLFGRFNAEYGDQALPGCRVGKVQELFCFLLLHRDRPYAREMLASLLWGNHSTTQQSKKYLRHTIWLLHTALKNLPDLVSNRLLCIDSDWILLRSIPELWLDVAIFGSTYESVKGTPGHLLKESDAQALRNAIELYEGNLLENVYQEWCLCERERMLQIYLIMLDKLMDYCEALHQFEEGLSYGRRVLQYDPARECTHRQLMRLYSLAGDRTGALRQYHRCVAVLQEELDVGPSDHTMALYEHIHHNKFNSLSSELVGLEAEPSTLYDMIHALHQLQNCLTNMQQMVKKITNAAEPLLESQQMLAHPSDTSEDLPNTTVVKVSSETCC